MGIEALSRGAEHALFVDSAPAAVRTIRENLRRTRLEGRGSVRRVDALRALRAEPGQFDLVIVDPPYALAQPLVDQVLHEVAGHGVAASDGRVVLTRPAKSSMPVIPVNWALERRFSYGDAVVLVFRIP
jgi:16S rRNA G966 N2-methylase RsmD